MKCLKHFLLLACCGLLVVTTAAQSAHELCVARVPFKFRVADRTFGPGRYEFVLLGPGLVAVRDEHKRVAVVLMTRAVESDAPSPASKLVFKRDKKYLRLAAISIEKRSQLLEVVGEERPMRALPPRNGPIAIDPFSSALPDNASHAKPYQ